MEIGLKERLIGAIVLVILAAIIIPWVLKGPAPGTTVTKPLALPPAATTAAAPQEYRMDLTNPAAPVQPIAAAPSPASSSAKATAASPAAAPVDTQASAPSRPPVTIKPIERQRAAFIDASGKWVVQAGSYSSEANARSVENTLASHGYHAYISRFHKSGRIYYRVRVGPYADRATAEHIVAGVARAYGGHAEVVTNS